MYAIQKNVTYDATGQIIVPKTNETPKQQYLNVHFQQQVAYNPNSAMQKYVQAKVEADKVLEVAKEKYVKESEKIDYLANQEQLYRNFIKTQEATYLNSLANAQQNCKRKMDHLTNAYERELANQRHSCNHNVQALVDSNRKCNYALKTMDTSYPSVFNNGLLEN
jgi:hypothetical protein